MTPTLFIISLKDAVERRAPLLRELDAHDITYELWNAVDGRSELAPEYERLIDKTETLQNLGRPMSNAEYGCALSHHLVYQAILDRGLNSAIILEDDAIVGEEFFKFLEMYDGQTCELLLLDHERALVSRADRIKINPRLTAYRCKIPTLRTTGYAVSRAGAEELVKHSPPVAALADWPVDITQMQAYAIAPRLVGHPDAEIAHSYIEHDRDMLQRETVRESGSWKRFLKLGYWRRTYYKRFGKRVS